MFAMPAATPMHDELSRLASALDTLDMRAAALFAEDLVGERDRLVRAIRSYLIPRLTEPDRPLTVVITGPTGSGKSTLLNSLLGIELAETGALRPTTKTPLVVTTADNSERFARMGGIACHVATARTPILTRMALVDTPDIDSTSVQHRAMAEALVDAADMVVFVTSALRYADRVPWEMLRRAARRGAPLISVLNRLSPAAAGAAIDYGSRLARAGIEAEIVRVTEQRGAARASIPAVSVRELSRRLYAAADGMEGRPVGMSVAITVLGDVSRLEEAIEGLARLMSRRHEAIAAVAGEGGAAVELDGVAVGLSLPLSRRGPLRRLLRLRPPPLEDHDLAAWLEVLAARIHARVAADSAATARGIDEVLPFPVADALLEPVLVTLESAVRGWLAQLHRMTEGIGRRGRNRATAALAWGALVAGDEQAEAELGSGARRLAAGARADLEARLAVVFSQMEMVASAMLEARAPRPDPGDLGDLVRQVNARLAFVDA